MSVLGKTVVIKGELIASEDLTIEGTVEGPVRCEKGAVTIVATAAVTGDVLARDITVFGHSAGRLVAADVVDIRPEAVVTGQVISQRFILHEGASFNGRAEPQHLEAAMRVAKYQQQTQGHDEGQGPRAKGQ